MPCMDGGDPPPFMQWLLYSIETGGNPSEGGKTMLKYTAKRLAYSVLILFFVMFIIYVLMYNMPSGFVETKARELASRPGATAPARPRATPSGWRP